jgi:hypothetical protein
MNDRDGQFAVVEAHPQRPALTGQGCVWQAAATLRVPETRQSAHIMMTLQRSSLAI